VLALGEIRRSIERAMAKDPARAAALDKWLGSVSKAFAERILPIDRAVSAEWGRLSARRPVPVIDALLAATANVNGMVLVTRNVADVADIAARYFDPSSRARARP
jgi:predicted nucleic acid-binding protein